MKIETLLKVSKFFNGAASALFGGVVSVGERLRYEIYATPPEVVAPPQFLMGPVIEGGEYVGYSLAVMHIGQPHPGGWPLFIGYTAKLPKWAADREPPILTKQVLVAEI